MSEMTKISEHAKLLMSRIETSHPFIAANNDWRAMQNEFDNVTSRLGANVRACMDRLTGLHPFLAASATWAALDAEIGKIETEIANLNREIGGNDGAE